MFKKKKKLQPEKKEDNRQPPPDHPRDPHADLLSLTIFSGAFTDVDATATRRGPSPPSDLSARNLRQTQVMARRSETRKKVGDLLRPYLPDLPFNGHQHNLLGMRLVCQMIPTQNEPRLVPRDLRPRAVPCRRNPTNKPSLLNLLGVLDEGRRRKNSLCQEYVAPQRAIKAPPPRGRGAPSAASHRAPSAACRRNPSAASREPLAFETHGCRR